MAYAQQWAKGLSCSVNKYEQKQRKVEKRNAMKKKYIPTFSELNLSKEVDIHQFFIDFYGRFIGPSPAAHAGIINQYIYVAKHFDGLLRFSRDAACVF